MTVDTDRAAGALVGLAAGDALGAPYEFAAPVAGEDAAMIGGGLGDWAPGEWTDDTQMAICIARVTATGSREATAIGEAFLDWYASDPADVGVQTRAVLSRADRGAELRERAAEHFAANPDRAAGNGSLMRTAPVALAGLGDDEAIATMAREVSALTHGDPLAGEACVLWCVAIDRAVRHARLDGIRDGLDWLPADRRARWQEWIDDAEHQPAEAFRPNGFVVTALQAAHSAIHHTPIPHRQPGRHLERALRRAVSIGDDTDTVAAIAGGLLGARWGRSAIPLAWQRLLHGWPGLTTRDLTALAVRTATGDRPDASGWPTSPSLLPHYRQVEPADPLVCPAPGDPGLLLGNVHGLATVAADAVVSLCRVGPADPPAGVEHLEVHLVDQEGKNPNLAQLLDDTAATIHTLRREGKTVFVHCAGARSRTPTVAAWYLAGHTGRPPLAIVDELADVLPALAINPEFHQRLAHTTPNWTASDE